MPGLILAFDGGSDAINNASHSLEQSGLRPTLDISKRFQMSEHFYLGVEATGMNGIAHKRNSAFPLRGTEYEGLNDKLYKGDCLGGKGQFVLKNGDIIMPGLAGDRRV